MRIGVPHDFFYAGLDPEVQAATEQAITRLKEIGAEIREVITEVSTDRTVIQAEAYAYPRKTSRSTLNSTSRKRLQS
jgi:Asp-tRNA(Asn)/Glu-tRNA(Gln) amidotransferase A subunit family amidase